MEIFHTQRTTAWVISSLAAALCLTASPFGVPGYSVVCILMQNVHYMMHERQNALTLYSTSFTIILTPRPPPIPQPNPTPLYTETKKARKCRQLHQNACWGRRKELGTGRKLGETMGTRTCASTDRSDVDGPSA